MGTADQSATLRPMMSMFMAVLVTFVCTRVITRRIRSRAEPGGALKDIAIGGVHIHHQVFGIVIMLCSGMALISATPEGVALHVVAAVFGVGVSLTFDEFALWLHVEDVYWSTEGRQSVDAMFCVLVTTGLLVGGVDFVTGAVGTLEWWVSVAVLALDLALSVICVLKGKLITAVIGLFLQPVAIAGGHRRCDPTGQAAVLVGSQEVSAQATSPCSRGASVRRRLRGPLEPGPRLRRWQPRSVTAVSVSSVAKCVGGVE
ncbi:MAG: hypothetical protein ACXVXI_11080 [Mycobacteriaceae bacterium]